MDIQEVRRQMFMVKGGFPSLIRSRSSGDTKACEVAVGDRNGQRSWDHQRVEGWEVQFSSSGMAAFPRRMTRILLERKLLKY